MFICVEQVHIHDMKKTRACSLVEYQCKKSEIYLAAQSMKPPRGFNSFVQRMCAQVSQSTPKMHFNTITVSQSI